MEKKIGAGGRRAATDKHLRILIPENLTQNVLAAVRHLRRHHITLAGHGVKYRSRYIDDVIRVANPLDGPCDFCTDIADVQGNYDVILPFGHVATTSISLFRSMFETPCLTPPYEILKYGHDKSLTVQKCAELNIGHPAVYDVPGARCSSDNLTSPIYPCVVKARKNCGVETGIRYVNSPSGLQDAVDIIKSYGSAVGCYERGERWGISPPINDYTNPMIQEYIPGDTYDCVGLFDHGAPVVMVTQRRVETVPIRGGVGAYNVTTYDLTLRGLTYRLLHHLNWHGPFQAEWKLDTRDNQYKLIELNPKMWGTMELAMRAGVDIPGLAIRVAMSGDGPHDWYLSDYTSGVKMIWPSGILYNLFEEPSFRRLAMMFYHPVHLLDPVPDVVRLGAIFMRSTHAITHAILRSLVGVW